MRLLARRLVARLIDCWLLFWVLVASWGLALVLMMGESPDDASSYPEGVWLGVILFVAGTALALGVAAPILYDLLGLRYWQRTIGMSVLGLRVSRLDGTPLGWRRSFFRSLAFWLLGPFPVVALYDAAFTPGRDGYHRWLEMGLAAVCIVGAFVFSLAKRRAFHDWVADSRVAPV